MNQTYIKKFARQLGTTQDFINHVRQLQLGNRIEELRRFRRTPGNKRYLLIENGVIDFVHFFSAMMQSLAGMNTVLVDFPATSTGTTLALGVGNELLQCANELTNWNHQSCFAREDLFSNRLGAEFAAPIKLDTPNIAGRLEAFLSRYQPVPTNVIQQIQLQSTFQIAGELLYVLARCFYRG